MIKDRSEMPRKRIEIDLSGPEGNAHVLLGYVSTLGKQLNIPHNVRKDIQATMMLGSYDDLIKTFDIWFGNYVTLYK